MMLKETREKLNTELGKEKIDGKEVTQLLEKAKNEPGKPTQYDMVRKHGHTDLKHIKRDWFPEEEKLKAAAVFATTGNVARTAEIVGIEASTIRNWKQKEWWQEYMARIHAEQDDEIDVKFTKIVNKALDKVQDHIENGDYIYDSRRGAVVRVPVKAKDMAIVSAISVDKRQLLRGQPTSRVETVSSKQRLDKLQEEFKKFAKSRTIDHDEEATPAVEAIESETPNTSTSG